MEEPKNAEPKQAESKKNILLVEDDPDLLDFAAEVLHRLGYQVFKAEDASVALNVIEQEQISLDLVLSDIRLPGELSGIELVECALNSRPNLKILLASSIPTAI